MAKVAYIDGVKIGLITEDGARMERESEFIKSYRENARKIAQSSAWKRGGSEASMRGDYEFYDDEGEAPAILNGVTFIDGQKVAYSFTVGQSSGIYYKDFAREEKDETHFIHSNVDEFFALDYDKKSGELLAGVAKGSDYTASIARFTKDGDYVSLTDGDSRDDNPSFSPKDGEILFNSAGVGRDDRGNFVAYAPEEILSLDTLTLDITPLRGADDFLYIKPKMDENGDLYAIKCPIEGEKRNIFLDILLIPVRIVEAIVGFVQFFVMAFSGKSLISGDERGANPAKGRKKSEREIFVEGNLVKVDRELKKNKRFNKEQDYGFIPRSWCLVRIDRGGNEEVIRRGVCDYALSKDGIYCANGSHIHLLSADGDAQKIVDTDCCLHIAVDE